MTIIFARCYGVMCNGNRHRTLYYRRGGTAGLDFGLSFRAGTGGAARRDCSHWLPCSGAMHLHLRLLLAAIAEARLSAALSRV